MLEGKLRRGTASQRYGAAQFLICFGVSLGDALLAWARARLDRHGRSRDWDRYCLSLRFPAAVIDEVFAKKETLAGEVKLFVLWLAIAHGRQLDDADQAFVAENAIRLYEMPVLEAALSEEWTFRRLVDLLDHADWRVAAGAAEMVIQRYRSRLAPAVRLRCELLASERGSVPYEQRFRELELDPSRRAEVIEAGRELAKKYGRMFLLPALAEASADPTRWVDALWTLFGNGLTSTDDEDAGWGLIVIGSEFSHHGTAIGAAALRLCDDRMSGFAAGDVAGTPWLPLLAHEFGAVQTDDLLALINPYSRRPHVSSILAALAARAPSPTLEPAARAETPPDVVPASLGEVADAARDGEDPAGDLCPVIARTLYQDLDSADLERLAARGTRPRLIAGILQYVHGSEIEPAWILKIIGSDVFRRRRDHACHDRLRVLAQQAFRRLMREHPDMTRALLGAEIERGGSEALGAAMLAAAAGGSVSPNELAALLISYSEYPFFYWRPVLRFVMTETMRTFARGPAYDGLRRAISLALQRQMLEDGDASVRDPLALVVYALLARLGGAESSEAPVAFRQGLAALSSGDGSHGGLGALAEAVDLLEQVDPQWIRNALTSYQDDEPAIVAVALLLASFISPHLASGDADGTNASRRTRSP
jgi:hypothetical protein